MLDEYIDTGVEGFLKIATTAKEHPLDEEVERVLRENMRELRHMVLLRNALLDAA